MNTTIQNIVNFLQQHVQAKTAVIGLSGGIDSSVVAYLLAKALPAKQIFGMIMPSATTSQVDIHHAHEVAKQLQIPYVEITIDPIIDVYRKQLQDFSNDLAKANLQSRVRMTLLYGKANATNGLVIGTGNKSELMTGYFTKYGDGGVDILPIAHLYKYQVRAIAQALQVPVDIINKPPTAGLRANQIDEQELQVSYEVLDNILEAIEQGNSLEKFSVQDVQRVQSLMQQSEHKRHLPVNIIQL